MRVTQERLKEVVSCARININGKVTHIGTFKTASDAHKAYVLAKRRYHVGCTL